MLTKNDCLSILVKLETTGINVDNYIKQLLISQDIPIEVLKFIAKNNGVHAVDFYEMLRKNYNKKKSPLYINIVKEQYDDINKDIITLSCLLTQIVLYANKLAESDKQQFLTEIRAEEITRVLNEYFKTFDATNCITVLKLIKTDLLVLEYINDRRELK